MDEILRGYSELIDYESSLIVSRIKELGLVEKSRTYPVFAKDFNGWRYYYLTKISIGKTVEDIQQIESIFLIASNEDLLKCSCCALSMFKTLNAAQSRYNGMPKRVKQLLGYTNVATGEITKKTGVISTNDRSEHFDLFEYEKVELINSFKIVAALN